METFAVAVSDEMPDTVRSHFLRIAVRIMAGSGEEWEIIGEIETY